MKKKFAIIGIVILTISFGIFVYNKVIVNSFRYPTIKDAFYSSCPPDSTLIGTMEDKDVALLIYENDDGTYSDDISAKDTRGWSPISIKYKIINQTTLDNGFIYLKEVNEKYIVQVVITAKNDDISSISDNLDSTFMSKTYELDNDKNIVYGFLVTEENFANDYTIMVGEQEIKFQSK